MIDFEASTATIAKRLTELRARATGRSESLERIVTEAELMFGQARKAHGDGHKATGETILIAILGLLGWIEDFMKDCEALDAEVDCHIDENA